MTDADCSMAELQAVLLARDLRDGEKAIVGTNSDVQVAACNLARSLQAPTLWWVSGPGGMVNCNEPVIRSTARTENIAWSEAPLRLIYSRIEPVGVLAAPVTASQWIGEARYADLLARLKSSANPRQSSSTSGAAS